MRCVGPTLAREEITAVRKSLEFAPELEEAAELFNLASNSTRLKILFLLDRLKELCVCDLAEMLGVSVSAVSQHLAKLRAYGLTTTRRTGGGRRRRGTTRRARGSGGAGVVRSLKG